jgi:hypothetical protein
MSRPHPNSLFKHGPYDATPHMSECERYGMSVGCNSECPVYESGECEIEAIVGEQIIEDIIKEEVPENTYRDRIFVNFDLAEWNILSKHFVDCLFLDCVNIPGSIYLRCVFHDCCFIVDQFDEYTIFSDCYIDDVSIGIAQLKQMINGGEK